MKKTYYDIIKRPILSEKSSAISEIAGKYTFEVDKKSVKNEIKSAVEKLFNVKVKKVHTLTTHGKVKRRKTVYTRRPNKKKAIVSLYEGYKIEFYES